MEYGFWYLKQLKRFIKDCSVLGTVAPPHLDDAGGALLEEGVAHLRHSLPSRRLDQSLLLLTSPCIDHCICPPPGDVSLV